MEREKMNAYVKKSPAYYAENSETLKKFQNAEQLWFWFLNCRRKDFLRTAIHSGRQIAHNPYPCEAIDVETLITKLYLAGKLNSTQLEVLKKFGDMRRAPNQYVWAENTSAALWYDAMQKITISAKAKEWLE